jgi:hypothetical protein
VRRLLAPPPFSKALVAALLNIRAPSLRLANPIAQLRARLSLLERRLASCASNRYSRYPLL